MPKIIGVFGKGGTGKTTFTALLLKALIAKNPRVGEGVEPASQTLLAVDADPNICLPYVLGVENFNSLDGLVGEFEGKSIDPEAFESRFQGLLLDNSQNNYDLLVMGRGETGACYCYVNYLLKSMVERHILKGHYSYDYILMDCEAGLEHISRKTSSWVDNVIIVTDPSENGLRTAERIKKTILEVARQEGVPLGRLYLVANLNREGTSEETQAIEERVKAFSERLEVVYLGVIPYDKTLQQYSIEGKPLLDLPPENDAYKRVEGMIEKLLAQPEALLQTAPKT